MFCDDLSPRLKRAIPDRPIRVLVVDDQVDVAEALARLLRALGCAATSITEPAKALNTALGIEADIVFMDICMPGLDGYDLARMFREHFGEIVYLVAVTAEAGGDAPQEKLGSRV